MMTYQLEMSNWSRRDDDDTEEEVVEFCFPRSHSGVVIKVVMTYETRIHQMVDGSGQGTDYFGA